jgi:hypothetical protein
MSGEIVEHDDIAGAQRGHQDLLDVRTECGVVDRPSKTDVAVISVDRGAATTVCVCQ